MVMLLPELVLEKTVYLMSGKRTSHHLQAGAWALHTHQPVVLVGCAEEENQLPPPQVRCFHHPRTILEEVTVKS